MRKLSGTSIVGLPPRHYMDEPFHRFEEKEILSKNDDADEVTSVAELVNSVRTLKGGDARYTSADALRGQPRRSRLYTVDEKDLPAEGKHKKRGTIQNRTG